MTSTGVIKAGTTTSSRHSQQSLHLHTLFTVGTLSKPNAICLGPIPAENAHKDRCRSELRPLGQVLLSFSRADFFIEGHA